VKAKGIITLVTLSVLQSQQHRLCLSVELTVQSQLHLEVVHFAVTCYTNYDTSQSRLKLCINILLANQVNKSLLCMCLLQCFLSLLHCAHIWILTLPAAIDVEQL